MSTNQHNEAHYENTLIQLFQDLGYAYECGYDVERDYRNPYYEEDLRDALQRLNPMLSNEVLQEAFRLVHTGTDPFVLGLFFLLHCHPTPCLYFVLLIQ